MVDKMGVFKRSYVYQIIATNTASISLLIAGCWIAWPSVMIKRLTDENPDLENIGIRLNKYQLSWMVSLLDLGNAISPIFAGILVEKIGRKTTLLLNALLCLPTWFLVVSNKIECLYIARLFIGISKGVAYTAMPIFIGEISEHNIRGALGSIPSGFQMVGTLAILLIGNHVSYNSLNIALSILPVIFFILFSFVPETPHFHAAKNNLKKTEKSLKWYRGNKKDVMEEMNSIMDKTQEDLKSKTGYLELLTNKSNRRAFTLVMAASLFQRLGGITSMITYSSTLLPKLDNAYFGPDQCILVFMIIMFLSNFLQAPLMDILGRKPLSCFSAALGCLLTFSTGLFYLYQGELPNFQYIPYITTLLYAASYYGIGCLPNILVSELFPINVRCQASSCASVALAFGSFITTKFHILITKSLGQHVIFFIYSSVHFCSVVFNYFYLMETKQKTLAEIQEKLNKKTKSKK
ncbi:facilitated trehalose transporter Tret1-like [Diaphorina citri]|uniref:Facilitated trehalose transporter Tret1-like n=1 Tax=Diaphorina citri TaxID=121845 RepID=A0A1S3CXR2_DIACI|nr:facilitated trehalose transporter Tret1-like [Diaphorina citri]